MSVAIAVTVQVKQRHSNSHMVQEPVDVHVDIRYVIDHNSLIQRRRKVVVGLCCWLRDRQEGEIGIAITGHS